MFSNIIEEGNKSIRAAIEIRILQAEVLNELCLTEELHQHPSKMLFTRVLWRRYGCMYVCMYVRASVRACQQGIHVRGNQIRVWYQVAIAGTLGEVNEARMGQAPTYSHTRINAYTNTRVRTCTDRHIHTCAQARAPRHASGQTVRQTFDERQADRSTPRERQMWNGSIARPHRRVTHFCKKGHWEGPVHPKHPWAQRSSTHVLNV